MWKVFSNFAGPVLTFMKFLWGHFEISCHIPRVIQPYTMLQYYLEAMPLATAGKIDIDRMTSFINMRIETQLFLVERK